MVAHSFPVCAGRQLRELAINANRARSFGIEPESDTDNALNLYTLIHLLMFPSSPAMTAAASARSVVQGALLWRGVHVRDQLLLCSVT